MSQVIEVHIDGNNKDVLYAMRVEQFFEPNEDGSPSLNGRVVWHTQWWHYTGTILRGKSDGPRIERTMEDMLGETYEGITALQMLESTKAAFITHASQHLGLVGETSPDPEEDPEEEDPDPDPAP